MARNTVTRDFIYLDVERVRSIVAQRSGGLPGERTSGGEHNVSGSAGAEGGLPWIAKATGELGYHYTKSHSETRSLHDALFSEFFEGLESAKTFFNESFPDPSYWTAERFQDGAILVASGVFRITDYDLQVESIRSLPSLYETIARGNARQNAAGPNARMRNSQTRSTQTRSNRTGGNRQSDKTYLPEQLRNAPIEEVADLIERFYKGIIRIKLFPFAGDNDKFFLGSADRQSFRISPQHLIGLYGPVIDANWTAVIQINKGVFHEASEFSSLSGTALEDQIEAMGELFITMATFTQGIKFPGIAMTPIAIFRDV